MCHSRRLEERRHHVGLSDLPPAALIFAHLALASFESRFFPAALTFRFGLAASSAAAAFFFAHQAVRATDILARTLADIVRLLGTDRVAAGTLGGVAAPSTDASSFSSAPICSLMARAWRSWATVRLSGEFMALV